MKAFLAFQTEENMSLFTDLYELTMCASYFDNHKLQPATFDLFIRRLPPNRSYFLFAGLEQVLQFLETIKFTEEHITYLREKGFNEPFLRYLEAFKFTGEVYAAPEGSIVFPNEPLIRVTAPIIEAQLVETFLLNTINLQTMIATKASRVVQAAEGKPVVEFGLRREHGVDAGMKVARSTYLAGCNGTSNVLAGLAYGIPTFGTMAHSFIMSFPKEIDAFRAFTKTFPKKSILLIDTYSDLAGAEKAAVVAKELKAQGANLVGVRLDSGNLAETGKKVRAILDKNGLKHVTIFASGDLDEFKIESLLAKKACIDAFGVGTKMGTSADYPYLDVIYKLSETMNGNGEFTPIMKLSEGKITLPGRKQVYRYRDSKGFYHHDLVALSEEKISDNCEPLLLKVMENGKILNPLPSLDAIRASAKENLQHLPVKYKKLTDAPAYPVKFSQLLSKLVKSLEQKIREEEIKPSNLP
jgi:nicotinate phosphoribosyltransferase